jgi:hypothetical protein
MPPLPPTPNIALRLEGGHVVPFLGAGVNTRPDPAAVWKKGAPFLPRGAELSEYLARMNGFPSDDPIDRHDLAKVASYAVEASGRGALRDNLRAVFDRAYEPCAIHDYLASVPANLLIVTTNYDDLTEVAFRRAGRQFHLVVHPTDRQDAEAAVLWWRPGSDEPEEVAPNSLRLKPGEAPIIYKMHGTVYRHPGGRADLIGAPGQVGEVLAGAAVGAGAGELAEPVEPVEPPRPDRWDSYVITEDDYVEFLSRMTAQTVVPSHFIQHFQRSQFLFLGYGLNDWNLRVVLRNLRRVLPRGAGAAESPPRSTGPSWAIQYRPSLLETRLWEAREVDIYDMDIDGFVSALAAEREDSAS